MIGNLPSTGTIARFSPWEGEDDLDACMVAVRRTLASGIFIGGPEVEAFEREAAAFLGVPGTLGVASGSDALTIALLAATDGLSGGDVLVPALTFVATAEAVVRAGFRPRFVDVLSTRSFSTWTTWRPRSTTRRARSSLSLSTATRSMWRPLRALPRGSLSWRTLASRSAPR